MATDHGRIKNGETPTKVSTTPPAGETVGGVLMPGIGTPDVRRWSSEIPRWDLYCGQAVDALNLIQTDSVDCIVTSPPYYWLRDYGVSGQIGMEDNMEGYVSAITNVMEAARRVLKPTGTLFLNLGDTYYSGKGRSRGTDRVNRKRRFGVRAVDKGRGMGIGLQRKTLLGMPWRVAFSMCESGWTLRSPIIWVKKGGVTEPVRDRPSRSYEYVFLFARSQNYHFDKSALRPGMSEDIWHIPVRSNNAGVRDSAPFPEELVERCLDVGSPRSGVVLDPFCGSGTTLRVALRRGHYAIGIDLNPKFCDQVRLDLEVVQPEMTGLRMNRA